MINGFAEARAVLREFVPTTKQDYSLDGMRKLMAALGNPQENYPVVHIAGTSGKTSTAYYIAALLGQAGKKVGLTVSPHVDEVNERVQINLKPLSEKEFSLAISEFLEATRKTGFKPTYFELLVAFAYWEFARQKVDYAVIEVGLGGLLDGTNVISRKDKVCVITDIGLDHTHILGDTLSAIASQKAGIIHPGNVALAFSQGKEIDSVIAGYGRKQDAKILLLDETQAQDKGTVDLAGLPSFQKRNWLLAKGVYDFMQNRDGLPELDEQSLEATLKTSIPGRMDVIKWGAKTLVMDGAHNTQKMRAFVKAFEEQFPGTRPAILLSVRTKKYSQGAIEELLPIASALILTKFKVVQDIAHESAKLRPIAEFCESKGFDGVVIEPDQRKALELLKRQESPVCVITGSFYLLNHIRPLILKSND